MSPYLCTEHQLSPFLYRPKASRSLTLSWKQSQKAVGGFTVSPSTQPNIGLRWSHLSFLTQVIIFLYRTEFKAMFPTSVCIYYRLKSVPSCKHPGLQIVPLSCAELFQDISISRIGKTSKQLQHNQKKQGVYHNQNVLPKCSTTLLTSPPVLLIIHYGQENGPKYNFLFVFSLTESLCKILLYPHC